MAEHSNNNKKPGTEKKAKISVDLERLKRSPYLVTPILSPKHGSTIIKKKHPLPLDHPTHSYGAAAHNSKRTDQSPPKAKAGGLSPRGGEHHHMINIHRLHHEPDETRPGAAAANSSDTTSLHAGLPASLRTLTEHYFTTGVGSSGIDCNTKHPPSCNHKQWQAQNLHEYYLAGGKLAPPQCSDFVGPVKVQEVGNGMGRGLVLTADVEPGDLLVVSNPLAKLYKHETEMAAGVAALEDMATNPGASTANVLQDQLVKVLCGRAANSSRDRALLSRLCKQRNEVLPVPSMSIFGPSGSCDAGSTPDTNDDDGGAIRPPSNLEETSRPIAAPSQQEVDDMVGVVRCNAFGHAGVLRESEQKITRSWSCGIWMLPSFVNHSCTPNCAMVLVGDAVLVVAARKMRRGSQLTAAYFDVFRPLKERRESMRGWDFECRCKRCELEDALHDSLDVLSEDYAARDQGRGAHNIINLHSNDTWQRKRVLDDLGNLGDRVQEILSMEPGLSILDKSWIRGSFIQAYLVDGKNTSVAPIETWHKPHTYMTHLELALESAEAICRGQLQTLQIAVSVLERVRTSLGSHSFLFKTIKERALNCCRCLFGHQSEEVQQKLLKVTTLSTFPSGIVFLRRN